MEIALKVENKNIIVENEVKIVNSNTDYVLSFTFDEEWDEFNEKTLRIEFNNNDYVDTIFTGNTVTLPPIFNQKNFRLGVYAGDLHSTTALVVYCKDSIVDGKGDEYILKPTESIEITNTEEVDVTHYATAQVVDNDLVAGNIRKGANILGVEGSYEPEPPVGNQDIETLDEYNVSDKATARISTAERAKIIPANIISGKTILGITGQAIVPTGNQDINDLSEYNVASKATARISAAERAKIIPENIKKDVTLLGVTGTLEEMDENIVYATINQTVYGSLN